MFRVYQVKIRFFYVIIGEQTSTTTKILFPAVDVPDKTAFAHAVVTELNRQYAAR